MRVLVIENYPKTTLGLVGERSRRGGRGAPHPAHASRRRRCRPRRTAMTRSSCSAARRMRSTTQTIPICRDEAALARAFGEADKAVLGICLGAQILARALRRREHPRAADRVRLARGAADRSRPRRPGAVGRSASGAPLFHWHLDTFTLPPGAVHLATSDMTQMQAFRIGRAVYGIQFHFEAGTELVEGWTRDFADEIAEYAPDWPERHPRRSGEARRGGRRRRAGARRAPGSSCIRAAPPQAAARPARNDANGNSFGGDQHDQAASFLAAALASCRSPAQAAELPDLGGRTVKAVTENAYMPLNFADPKTGEGIGWEYDAFNEIAKRLNLKVEWNLSSWDTMIQAVREGQFDVGMDGITINDERKEQVDFSDPYMSLRAVHAGARRREPLHRRQELRRRTRTSWSARRPARPISTPPSTTCSTATRPIRASSCSTRSAPRCRR